MSLFMRYHPTRLPSLLCIILLIRCVLECRAASAGTDRDRPNPQAFSTPVAAQPAVASAAYRSWNNVRIDGGGFVTGLIASGAPRGPLYARTDVGGAYRWIGGTKSWLSVTDGFDGCRQIESMAADPLNPYVVYMASGGQISRSANLGVTWTSAKIPVRMAGNGNGRCVGERLAIDPTNTNVLFYGSRMDGLFRSGDSGSTWAKVPGFDDIKGQTGITFVLFDPRGGNRTNRTIYLGVDGAKAGLYRSFNGGATWFAVPGQPTGLFPNHAAFNSKGLLFLAYANGPGPGDMTDGAVWRFDAGVLGAAAWKEITPVHPGKGSGDRFGYGGIAIDPNHPGTLVIASMDRWAWGDAMWRTEEAGAKEPVWTVLFSRSVKSTWLSPVAYKARDTHWISSIAYHPTFPDQLFFSFGQGVQRCDRVSAGENATWNFSSQGLEETVVLCLASPPVGPHLLSGLGDIGGFAHPDLTASPPVRHSSGNTTSVDFAALAPAVMARVGSKPGKYSLDGGATWIPFRSPGPESNGSIAVSADGKTFIWSGGDRVSRTSDLGATWTRVDTLPNGSQVVSDRVNPIRFYGFHKKSGVVYYSRDGGATFAASETRIDGTHFYLHAGIYAVPGVEGQLYVCNQNWRFQSRLFRSTDSARTLAPVPIGAVRSIRAFGFGKAFPGNSQPAIYIAGTMKSSNGIETEGVFRSDNGAVGWVRIDDDRHRFGVDVIVGDSRIPGRVYLGTSGRGIVYADP